MFGFFYFLRSLVVERTTYMVVSVGELQSLVCERQCGVERVESQSQVGAVRCHDAPVDAGVRRTAPANP